MMIRLIGFDLDDTLLNSKREIQDIKGLTAAIKHDVKICFCSGRPYLQAVKDLYKTIGLTANTYYVAYNGVVIYNIENDSVIYSNKLDKKDVKEINNIIEKEIEKNFKNNDLSLYIYNENNDVIAKSVNEYTEIERVNNGTKIIIDDFVKMNTNAYKYMVGGKPEIIQKLFPLIKDELSIKYETFISMPCFIEVIQKGVDKYEALAKVAKAYSLNANEIMSFGDSMNDYTLIKNSYIGIAMGNSVSKIKDTANYVTSDNDHYGITEALIKYNVIKKSDL